VTTLAIISMLTSLMFCCIIFWAHWFFFISRFLT